MNKRKDPNTVRSSLFLSVPQWFLRGSLCNSTGSISDTEEHGEMAECRRASVNSITPSHRISPGKGGPVIRSPAVRDEGGFSMTELMVALVIIGVLVLLALPRLMPVVTKAKTTEAKLGLKQIYMLQKSHKFEYDRFSENLTEIGFEQEALITEGGTARYKIEAKEVELETFTATATAVVDFDNDGIFNVWEVKEDGVIRETIPD